MGTLPKKVNLADPYWTIHHVTIYTQRKTTESAHKWMQRVGCKKMAGSNRLTCRAYVDAAMNRGKKV